MATPTFVFGNVVLILKHPIIEFLVGCSPMHPIFSIVICLMYMLNLLLGFVQNNYLEESTVVAILKVHGYHLNEWKSFILKYKKKNLKDKKVKLMDVFFIYY